MIISEYNKIYRVYNEGYVRGYKEMTNSADKEAYQNRYDKGFSDGNHYDG